jgi:hypothetical protein
MSTEPEGRKAGDRDAPPPKLRSGPDLRGAFKICVALYGRYVQSDDPLVSAGNRIALMVAANQPFYPLYLYGFVTHDIASSFLTFFSTPFFVAVPAVSRRFCVAGRALLVVSGVANTLLCLKLFGAESAVELFLLPCLLIASLLFRRSEKACSYALVAGIIALSAVWRAVTTTPQAAYSQQEYAAFVALHAYSVAVLTIFIGFTVSRALFEQTAQCER